MPALKVIIWIVVLLTAIGAFFLLWEMYYSNLTTFERAWCKENKPNMWADECSWYLNPPE